MIIFASALLLLGLGAIGGVLVVVAVGSRQDELAQRREQERELAIRRGARRVGGMNRHEPVRRPVAVRDPYEYETAGAGRRAA